MTNLDSILKSRDITLLTKVHLLKAVVFPVVMYGCESWTVKKAECQRVDAFELWCWRRLLRLFGASLVTQRLKRLPPMWETRVRSLGQEDPLEKEMATHSSILAWRIPWTEKPSRLQSMVLQESDRT